MNFIKLFESFNSIQQDIKDILWEIANDNNFHVKVREISRGPNKLIVTLGDELYDLDMVAIDTNKYVDEFIRLKEYMEMNGYKFNSISYDERGELVFPKTLYGLKGEKLFNHLFEIPITNYIRIYFK